jgi:TetR/AcrR family transcriptional regulator, transcriptional repressor for nem operon
LTAVRNALVYFATRKDLTSTDGCMGMNAICEFGQRDDEVNGILREAARKQREALKDVLTRAKTQAELDSDADVDSLADFFESTLAGIRMAAKSGKSRQALRDIATLAARIFVESD